MAYLQRHRVRSLKTHNGTATIYQYYDRPHRSRRSGYPHENRGEGSKPVGRPDLSSGRPEDGVDVSILTRTLMVL